MTDPRYAHDCDQCHWLGTFLAVDIWWCPNWTMRNLDSVIGRFGSDGPEYAATHPPQAFANPEGCLGRAEAWYIEALKRAEIAGLYRP